MEKSLILPIFDIDLVAKESNTFLYMFKMDKDEETRNMLLDGLGDELLDSTIAKVPFVTQLQIVQYCIEHKILLENSKGYKKSSFLANIPSMKTSSGLEREFALNLAKRRWNVVVTACNQELLQSLCAEIEQFNVKASTALDVAIGIAWPCFHKINVLINNVGFRGDVHECLDFLDDE
ncbi:hypothetical protein SUGI_0363260 [Cryptomeria japonica]|nr:hypothetical protein SUGI_0363260 [Cryptomeria japonica]